MPPATEKLHIIVPCKGRLEFLKQTIPAAAAQPDADYTLVDYSCPDKCGEWAHDNYPNARIIFVKDKTYWHASEARNIGAKSVEDGWLCFLDSDVVVSPDFSRAILSSVKPGTYLVAPDEQIHLFGMLVCSKVDFDTFGGYDEVIRGWGYEDNDLRASLDRLGLTRVILPEGLMRHIDHPASLRSNLCEIREVFHSSLINYFYLSGKEAALAGGQKPDAAALKRLYDYTKDRILAGFPWLTAMDRPNVAESHAAVMQTLTTIGQDFKALSAEPWGDVHAFRIELLSRGMISELFTSYQRQTIDVRVDGHSPIPGMGLAGESLSFPVVDGKARVILTGEPIFLIGAPALVKDLHIAVAPGIGPAAVVDLTPAPDFKATVEVAVIAGRQPAVRKTVVLNGEPVRLRIPVTVPVPERPEKLTVRVAGEGFQHEVVRRTSFLTAPKVTEDEAMNTTPPVRAHVFSFGGHRDEEDEDGPESLRTDCAWGWTDTALVCWMARYRSDFGPVPEWTNGGCKVEIGVQPDNIKSQLANVVTFTVDKTAGEPFLIFYPGYLQAQLTLPGTITLDQAENRHRMAARLPFDKMEIIPKAGDAVGLRVLCADIGAAGGEAVSAWGQGVGLVKSPRLYIDLTLAE